MANFQTKPRVTGCLLLLLLLLITTTACSRSLKQIFFGPQPYLAQGLVAGQGVSVSVDPGVALLWLDDEQLGSRSSLELFAGRYKFDVLLDVEGDYDAFRIPLGSLELQPDHSYRIRAASVTKNAENRNSKSIGYSWIVDLTAQRVVLGKCAGIPTAHQHLETRRSFCLGQTLDSNLPVQ